MYPKKYVCVRIVRITYVFAYVSRTYLRTYRTYRTYCVRIVCHFPVGVTITYDTYEYVQYVHNTYAIRTQIRTNTYEYVRIRTGSRLQESGRHNRIFGGHVRIAYVFVRIFVRITYVFVRIENEYVRIQITYCNPILCLLLSLYVFVRIRTYSYVFVRITFVFVRICTYLYVFTASNPQCTFKIISTPDVRIRTYSYVFVRIRTYYVCIRTYMYVSVRICC